MTKQKHAAGRWKLNIAEHRKVVQSNAIYLLKAGTCSISLIEGSRLRAILFETPDANVKFAKVNSNE